MKNKTRVSSALSAVGSRASLFGPWVLPEDHQRSKRRKEKYPAQGLIE